MLACGAWRPVELRNAFHMSITASRIRLHFFGPSQAKNISMLASERSVPPNQIGRRRSRSLTTIRYVCPFADRDLVDPNGPCCRRAYTAQLLAHVLHLQALDRSPIEMRLLGDILDRGHPAAAAHKEREPFGVERIVREQLRRVG